MPESPAPAPRRRRPIRLSPLGLLLRRRSDWGADERARVEQELFFEGERRRPFLRRFFVLLTLASTIAALGLIADSAAVVIGAMLVSPLMTPIVASAAALVSGDLRRLAAAAAVLAGGVAAGIAIGWATAKLTGSGLGPSDLNQQLLDRTGPQLLDLGIAVVAGLAAGYVLTDRDAFFSIPGVAIAVALVPPLVTVGVMLELGDGANARGAALLFATNLVAILFATALVLLGSGYVDRGRLALHHRRVSVGIALSAVATLLLAIPLALHTRLEIQDELLRQDVDAAVASWAPDAELLQLAVDREGDNATVALTVSAPQAPPPAHELAAEIRRRAGIERVETTVHFRLEQRSTATAG